MSYVGVRLGVRGSVGGADLSAYSARNVEMGYAE